MCLALYRFRNASLSDRSPVRVRVSWASSQGGSDKLMYPMAEVERHGGETYIHRAGAMTREHTARLVPSLATFCAGLIPGQRWLALIRYQTGS